MIQKGSHIALSWILISVWWPTSATVIKNSRRPWDISRLVMLEDGRRLHHKSMMRHPRHNKGLGNVSLRHNGC